MYSIFALLFFLSLTSARRLNAGLNRFKEVIIFGDSYSDTGNAYKLSGYTWPIVPPYYQGQFCNGPNWADRLEALVKINYAYGGATTDKNFVQGSTKDGIVLVPGVRQQIQMYLNDTSTQTIDFDRTLYAVWAGANDFVYDPSLTPIQIVNSLMNQVRFLLSNGAKSVLVFNALPIQALPYVRALNLTAYLTQFTIVANTAIATTLQAIQRNNTQASIYMFDVYQFFIDIVSNTSSTTFTNKVDPCWTGYNLTAVQILCPDASKYVFIDIFHLSTPMHELIIEALNPLFSFTFIKNSSVGYIHSF